MRHKESKSAELAKRNLCVYCIVWIVTGVVLFTISSSLTDPNGLSIPLSEPCHVLMAPNYTLLLPVPVWLTCNQSTNVYEIDVYVSTAWNDHVNRLCFGMEPTEASFCFATKGVPSPSCHGRIVPDLSFLNKIVVNAEIPCKLQDGMTWFVSDQAVNGGTGFGNSVLMLLRVVAAVIIFASSMVLLALFCSEKGPAACRKRCLKLLDSYKQLRATADEEEEEEEEEEEKEEKREQEGKGEQEEVHLAAIEYDPPQVNDIDTKHGSG